MKNTGQRKILLSWLWVILCSIAIFLTVPVARKIQGFVSEKWGREAFLYFVLSALSAGFLILLYFLTARLKIRSVMNYIWLFIIGGIYTHYTLQLKDRPEEAIHFLEYGLLSYFLFKALSHHVKDKTIYLTATLFALFVGTIDEILQWITPERLWDFRDVWLNTLSGGLFQLVLFLVIKPRIIAERISPKSIKIFLSVLISCVLLLGLCVSNTPARVAKYTSKVPWLHFLRQEESMSEFGYKYEDPEIGIFYSRLNPKKLKQKDAASGEDFAQILDESVSMKYREFLKIYTPITNPFLHELRVHIFRRDRYFREANKASDEKEKKEKYLIAYKENLILEKYFIQSIGHSTFKWKRHQLRKAEALIDKSQTYMSPVSANIFTAFSEKTIWFSIFILICISVIAYSVYRMNRRQQKKVEP